MAYGKSFTCKGGKEQCDRRCTISVVGIEGRKYPFGGACNRYYNLRHDVHYDVEALDLVRLRQRLVYETYGVPPARGRGGRRPRVGLNRSLLVNSFYPLYSNFFNQLGFDPVLPDAPSQEGIDQRGAPFCYPVELAHGFFETLLNSDPPLEFIFLPHLKAVPNQDPQTSLQSQVCPLVQGESFYLRTAFKERLGRLAGTRLLTPLLNMSAGLEAAEAPLVAAAAEMGVPRRRAREAFAFALRRQLDCFAEMKAAGRRALAEIEADPERFGVVILSRPYNGFADEAHMGIPHKFASRGVTVIPMDFLDVDADRSKRHMYWGMGKLLMKAARVVQTHPQLFGTYVTNFSCGPDSFLIGYFRDIMGRKPSLTLELDSHTADAGLETRVEAFLDIVRAYRRLMARRLIPAAGSGFRPARTVLDAAGARVMTSSGETLPMADPRVTVLIPSMGRLGTEAFVSIVKGYGLHATAGTENDESILKIGRANTSCKECLPLILTTGTLLSYVRNGKRPDEVVVYFMPTGSGPCRFGQYAIFMEDLIRRMQIPNVAFLALSSDNSYTGMDKDFQRHAWWAVVVSDTMEDIRSMLLADAVDPRAPWAFSRRSGVGSRPHGVGRLRPAEVAARPLRRPVEAHPAPTPAGRGAHRQLDGRDLRAPRCAVPPLPDRASGRKGVRDALRARCRVGALLQLPRGSWLQPGPMTAPQKFKLRLRNFFQGRYERQIKSILAASGLVRAGGLDVGAIIENARPHLSLDLTGEAVLTVGGSLSEILRHACGVISIGPFGCMPNRLSEAILSETMTAQDKLATDPDNPTLRTVLTDIDDLPFLAIETDGSPFPQVITAKLEPSFCAPGASTSGCGPRAPPVIDAPCHSRPSSSACPSPASPDRCRSNRRCSPGARPAPSPATR